jgi:hypothetical protein
MRRQESVPLMKRMEVAISSPSAMKLLPKSKLGQAIGYMRNNWEALKRFLSDGRLPIDNNEAERDLRCIAIGRNYAESRAMRRCRRRRAGVWLNMPHWVVRFQVSNSA